MGKTYFNSMSLVLNEINKDIMKITKKEYINDLKHVIEYFESELKRGTLQFWYLGTCIRYNEAKQAVKENKAELERIATDKTYKPWNDTAETHAFPTHDKVDGFPIPYVPTINYRRRKRK